MIQRPSVRHVLSKILDADSYESWDEPVAISHHAADYRQKLETAAARSGSDESILTGRGLVRGRPIAIIANDFQFLGGSIGKAAAQRIIAAVRRATVESLPILATTSSGGTRMEEGTPAFVRMLAIAHAVANHKTKQLPYLVHLRHPTTGGVFASWGSMGHVTIAEPGAMIGFLGPKVYELLEGRTFPPKVQLAENLVARGVLDAIVPTNALAEFLDRTLSVIVDAPKPGILSRRQFVPPRSRPPVWDSVQRTRLRGRPGMQDVLRHGCTDTTLLHGTGAGERDDTILIALTRLDGQPCLVIGQDRHQQSADSPMGPAALRQAQRGMRLAEELGLPLVAFIDTPGAELSSAAEEKAIAGEIARSINAMSAMRVPTVSVLLGQGCGGGALALLSSRRVVAAEHSWLSPLPPEGASAIVHGDIAHAAEMAEIQKIGAQDLLDSGVVNRIIPEHPDTIARPEEFAQAIAAEAAAQVRSLLQTS